jgi:hypothetical protein
LPRRRSLACLALLAASVAPAAALADTPPSPSPAPSGEDARYEIAGGCYALRSRATGKLVSNEAGDGAYRATADDLAGAELFRMQATALGTYLLYGTRRDFAAAADGGAVARDGEPTADAVWRVDDAGGGSFRLVSTSTGRALAAGSGGRLALAAPEGDASLFAFEPAQACAEYPEVSTSAVGEPARGPSPYGEVRGWVDAHIHMMAFEFLGGRAHCGRPWHPFGVTHALVDCPDHYPNGAAAVLENTLSRGAPVGTHDPVGWPTFKDWPHYRSLTHEQTYWKWLERAWLGGLRVYVNLFVENAVLCDVYPYKQNSCNEMDSVRLQAKRIRELEDYIDAQYGGPGEGWFRIVTDPFQARRVINEGKLAVVLGIEVSNPLDCSEYNGAPECTREDIERGLDEAWDLGVRDMELVNKYDNALAGVAGDAGTSGPIVNSGNRYETGHYWDMQTCSGPSADHTQQADGANHQHGQDDHEYAHDNPQPYAPGTERDTLVGRVLENFLPQGALPVYTEPPHCNMKGLTALGEHMVRGMIRRGMIVDPDHLGVLARNQLLSILEAEDYSGVVSSHSWSTFDALPRILRLGGFVAPMAKASAGWTGEWQRLKPRRDPRHYWGIGYGADMNGFASQGPPRAGAAENPVTYPFKSLDGAVTLDRQRSGERVYDINVDGVAHYGLYPDWVEDVRRVGGEEAVEDLARGAEAYLQMWERAVGVPSEPRSARGRFTSRGLGRVRLGDTSGSLLRRAGQPRRRTTRAWRYDVAGRANRRARVVAALTPRGRVALVGSTAARHRFRRIGPGARASLLRGRTRSAGPGLLVRPAGDGTTIVYGIRRGRVAFVAAATRSVAATPARLRGYLRRAGLR